MKLTHLKAVIWAFAIVYACPVNAQNALTNPSFDAGPTRANGDVYFGSNAGNLSGWTLQGGTNANVVQVDGPGGYVYSNGPEQDASGAAAGTPQRYLDFGRGNKSIYQTFTAKCTATYRFGASFADRQRLGGTGQTMIVAGNTPTGALVASGSTVTIPAGLTTPYAWQPSGGTVSLVGGQTYTFKIAMDETYMNADQAFVQPASNCATQTVDVPGDHYQCYRVVRADALMPEKITVADQFGKAQIVLARPALVCNPSIKVHRDRTYRPKSPDLHLVCYTPLEQSDKPRNRRVQIGNQFQVAELELAERALFCVPSQKKLIGEREAPLN